MVKYVYDAWGNHAVLNANGNDITDKTNIGNLNPFRYRGYYYDVETGLYYLQTRYYDPELCRFITIDGIEYLDPEHINGLNLYAYCGNNPVMNIDPNGTIFFLCLLIGLIVGAIIGATVSGVTAYQNGARGWDLFGAILGGAIVGGAVGAIAGAIVGVGASLIGFGASAIGAVLSGGGLALAGGGVLGVGATAAVGIGAVVLGGAEVVGGVATGVLGLNVLFYRIGKSGGYKIDHHYPNDHDPAHVHISGDDGQTKIDLNGNPIQGNRPMTPGERKAFWKLFDKIIEALKPWF